VIRGGIFARVILAADIGGTNTRLRLAQTDGTSTREAHYEGASWASFDDVLRDFLRDSDAPISAACFAVAGPVWEGRAEVTNLTWTLDERALARAFSIGRVVLINDFHAVAAGVSLLGDEDLISLHPGTRDRSQPIAILGAGTGLGEAFVVGNRVITTEGSHGDFAPQDEEQARLFLHLHERYGHVSWERVVSGIGLVNIFTFLGGAEIDAAEIAALAERGDERAQRAVDIFVDAYGAEAGNMALRVLARGGVYLAGGIAAKNPTWFTSGAFIEAFLRKGRFRELVETIPVALIVREDVGLAGATETARLSQESR
jgi:glucokinase